MTWYYIIFVQPCKIACSMQQEPSTPLTYSGSCKTFFFPHTSFWWESFLHISNMLPLTYPGSCKTFFFPHTSFWWESFLHISNHWPTKWPTAHLHISLFDLVNPLISADSYPDTITHFRGFFSIFMGQLALKIHWVKMCFFQHLQHYKLHWNYNQSCPNQFTC